MIAEKERKIVMSAIKSKQNQVYSPAKGKLVPLNTVSDETFASGVLGPGVAVVPQEGEVYAPVEGKVSFVFPTKHAIGITTEAGEELLIHIGVDTVNLKGEGFTVHKNEGDSVKAHEKLISFNLEFLKENHIDPTVMMVYTNATFYKVTPEEAKQSVSVEDVVATVQLIEELASDKKTNKKERNHQLEYEELCEDILEAVGGLNNIQTVFHCITRLRIVPNDKTKVDFERLRANDGILKVLDSSGQVQCVIGTHVPEVYVEFLEVSGFKPDDVEETPAKTDDSNATKNPILKLLNTIAACVTPGLYAIVAGGMIKGIISLIVALGLLSSKSEIITILTVIGDAPFYFMPFTVGWAAAKRFRVKEIFGIMTAGILLYPTIMSPAEGVKGYQFIAFNIPAYNYKASIFPVIISVWLFSIVFHFIDRRMPTNLKIVFSGALSFLISAPLFLGFGAPLGNFVASSITGAFGWLFTNVGVLAGALFCGFIPFIVIFGIKGWSAIELQNLSTLGYDYMLPNFFYSNLAISGAVLAYAFHLKSGKERSAAISTGLMCILGITEPALYGIALPEKKPLVGAMIGGALAGAVAMILGVVTYAFSMPGITSIATYMNSTTNFVLLLVVMLIAWVSGFVVSLVLLKTGKGSVENEK